MKTLIVTALLCVLLYVGKCNLNTYLDSPFNANHPATLQEQSTHMLGVMYDVESEHPMGYCTGTVIGPHAILTAEHCNEGKALQLDSVLHTYKIVKVLKDGRDHVVFLVDGPAFYDVALYASRYPVVGEKVHIYGNGGRAYPAVHKTGTVLGEYAPSEIRSAAGMFYCSLLVIPGDSGSAIYGEDGKILGIVTYSSTENFGPIVKTHTAGFALNFTPEQIKEAQEF